MFNKLLWKLCAMHTMRKTFSFSRSGKCVRPCSFSGHLYGFFAAHRIIFHSPCSRLGPGIELLLLKHDSLLHLYFPLHSILRLGSPALLLFIVGHKWKAENFRGERNTLKTCTIYRYKVHLKTRANPQTAGWLNSIAGYPKTTCLGVHQGPQYSENGTIITAPICGCWVQETCFQDLTELRTTCWDDHGVQQTGDTACVY